MTPFDNHYRTHLLSLRGENISEPIPASSRIGLPVIVQFTRGQ